MKQITLLTIMMLTAVSTMAQKNISKVMDAIMNDRKISKAVTSNYDDSDVNGTVTTYCHYADLYLTKQQKTKIDELEEAFERDASKGYHSIHQTPDMKAEQSNVVYGPDLEYQVRFCTKPTRNYRLLFIHDTKNPDRRYVYAMVWYKKNNGIRLMLYRIYGKNPAKKGKSSTAKTFQIIPQDGNTQSTTTIVDGNGVRVITSRDGGKNWNIMENTLTDNKGKDTGADYLRQFGNLRVAFLESIKDSKEKALQTGIVMNIVELCKKHAGKFSDNERNTCKLSITEMQRILKQTNPDAFLHGMLDEAYIALGK